MNWKRIFKYAALLLVTGIVIGFVAGGHVLAGYVAYFVAFAAIFTHMAIRQHNRAFVHSALAFLIGEAVATLLLSFVPSGLSQPSLLLPELVVAVVALVIGTSLGVLVRRNRLANHAHGASR